MGISLDLASPRGSKFKFFDPGANAFQPTDLTGLELWLETRYITPVADGTAIQTWTDKSGLGNNFSQANAALRPIYKTNIFVGGAPALRFTRTVPNYLVNAAVTFTGTTHTFYYVIKPTTVGAIQEVFRSGDSLVIMRILAANSWAAFDGATRTFGAVSNGTRVILTYTLTAGASACYVNGVQSGAGAAWTANAIAGGTIGAHSNAVNPLTADYGAVLRYAANHSAAQRLQVHTYLSTVYGIAI